MFDTPYTGNYEPGTTRRQASRPATEVSEHDRQCKRFDGKLHGRISNATTREDWESLTTDLVAASTKSYTEVDGLRDNVKKRFLEDCPDPELRKKLNQALHAKKQGAIGHEVHKLRSNARQIADAKKAARSKRDRDASFAKKGPSNRTEPNHKNPKGGKK